MECAAASPDVAAAPARGITLAAVGAAIPDLALAGAFLATWIAPSPDRVWAINGLMLLMLLEFINVHSSAFMGQTIVSAMPRPQKAAAIVTLGAFYTLFVGAFSLAMRQLWPLVSFWGLTLNRLLGVLIGQAPEGEEALFLRRTWAASVMFYLLGAFVTTLAPLPRLGVSPAIMAHFNRMGTSGLWLDQPWRVLAFGFIYFTAVAVSELFGHRWISASALPHAH